MEGLPIHQNTLKKNHNPNNYSPFLKISTTTVVFTAALHRNSLQFSMCGVFVLFVFFFGRMPLEIAATLVAMFQIGPKFSTALKFEPRLLNTTTAKQYTKQQQQNCWPRMFVFFSHTKKMSLYYKMIQTECFCFIKLIVKFNFLFC